MCTRRYIPTYYANNIYEVDIAFYEAENITTLLIDLDNTLDSFKAKTPSEKARSLIENLHQYGYNIIIISNNKGNRVKTYADALDLTYLGNARKPFAYKIKKILAENDIDKEKTLLIGDQLMTDVRAAKRAGIRVMLTEKLVKEDQWTTHINRLFDRPIRRKLKRKNLLNDWREVYEQN